MIKEEHGIIYAYEFLPDGKNLALHGHEIEERIKDDIPTWIHMDALNEQTRVWLQDNVEELDHYTIQSLLEQETRPRLYDSKDGLMIILRGVNLHQGADPEDMISIRLWVDERSIISTQKRPLASVTDIKNLLDMGNGPQNASDFLVLLITRLIFHMEEVLRGLNDRIDTAEEHSINSTTQHVSHQDINDLRRESLILRRYFAPQKDVIGMLISSPVKWLDTNHRRQLFECLDRITRYIEDLDTIRERAQMVKEEMAHRTATKMNKNMFVLSVISSIFMPMSFLTGLLGSNIGGIPGSNYAYAFWIVCGLCATFAITMLMFFRRKKWL